MDLLIIALFAALVAIAVVYSPSGEFCFNFVGAPGAGKTTELAAVLDALYSVPGLRQLHVSPGLARAYEAIAQHIPAESTPPGGDPSRVEWLSVTFRDRQRMRFEATSGGDRSR